MTEHWRALSRGGGCCELLARLKEAYDTQHDEIERLAHCVAELEAAAALRHGSLSKPQQSETISFTWGVAPNAPGHEETKP